MMCCWRSTTLSFDIALLELFLPIMVGARVVVASREVASDGIGLSKALVQSEATVMQATPATWRLLLETGWEGNPGLKILCGGEALPRELAKQLLERCASLWNMYGPTETTVWSTVHRVEAGDGPVSIGRPIANTQIYLLDENLQPVPVGVVGTLYIGGDGLARGYLNRSELTAEKFIASPFSLEGDVQIYNTGDLARYLPDGRLECLGRIDHQVKVRGFRIELGEIEAALGQHEDVQKNVVIVREDDPGDKRLVAYFIPDQEPARPVSELRTFLRQKLPNYMIPAIFMRLEALPLTPNGKINRRALPIPDGTRPDLENTFVVPQTPIEQELAGIWTEILGLERVGVHDNFFDLGGHSLLATQVISRLRDTLRVELPLRRFFETPTVAGLAESIEIDRGQGQVLQLQPLLPVSRDGELQLSFAQQRLWILDQLEPDTSTYNILAAMRLTGPLDVAALEQSLGEIIRRHEALRTTFTTIEGLPVQVIYPPAPFSLPAVDLREFPEAEREAETQRLATEEAQRLFLTWPMVRY